MKQRNNGGLLAIAALGLAISNGAMPLSTIRYYDYLESRYESELREDSETIARYNAGIVGGIWSTINVCSALGFSLYICNRTNKRKSKEK